MIKPDRSMMERAIGHAKLARDEGDYAIGAVLIKGGQIISEGSSRSKREENPVAHAEALVILDASKKLKSRHLKNCILYSTNEPCPMCSSLAVFAKLKGIVYGARIEDMKDYRNNHRNSEFLWRTIDISCQEIAEKSTEHIEIVKDFLREDCLKLFHS